MHFSRIVGVYSSTIDVCWVDSLPRLEILGNGMNALVPWPGRPALRHQVVITDGGEEFTESAMFALRENLERNHCDLGLKERLPPCKVADAPPLEQAQVQLEKLTWGEHSDFLEKHGGADAPGGMGEGFDFVVAADVICE